MSSPRQVDYVIQQFRAARASIMELVKRFMAGDDLAFEIVDKPEDFTDANVFAQYIKSILEEEKKPR